MLFKNHLISLYINNGQSKDNNIQQVIQMNTDE